MVVTQNTNIMTVKNWFLIGILSGLFLVAGIFNGRMDSVQFHYSQTEFSKKGNDLYYNPDISWANKYKTDDTGSFIRDTEGKLQPRFFLSTTALVLFTDFWHLQQFFMLSILTLIGVLSFAFSDPISYKKWYWVVTTLIIVFILWKACFSLGFHISYV